MRKVTAQYCQEFHKIAWEQACSINPDNPQAVADGIKGLVEALEQVLPAFDSIIKTEKCDHSVGICWCADRGIFFLAKQALAKVREK